MNNFKRLHQIGFVVLMLLYLPNKQLLAQSKSDSTKKRPSVEAAQSVTEHSVRINGETVEYRAIAGTLPIYSNQNEPIASFGYTAYLKEGVDDLTKRPILFAFNGGPGSASMWLHLGALGPRRIKLNDPEVVPPAPYELVNNQYSPLNVADVVMIDPVGTGYSRAEGEKENKYFWDEQHDIQSISQFIKAFIGTHNRWNSPKYVLGESYGTFRLAGIANYLLSREGIALNGIALVGTVLDLRTIAFGPSDILPYVIYLPTYAAIARHYDKVDSSGSLENFMKEVQGFAVNEFAPALLKGNTLSDAEYKKVLNKLVQYTGLKKEFIDRANLRVKPAEFAKRILHDTNKIVGRYDGRYNSSAMEPTVNRTFYDPSSSAISPAFETMFLQYYHEDLNFGKDRQYMFSARGLPGFNWDWESSRGWPTSPNTASGLAKAMTLNPYLKVHIISGYYDLATPFFGSEYTFRQMNIPEEAQDNIQTTFLKAGHMSYIRLSALKKMHEVLSDFIK